MRFVLVISKESFLFLYQTNLCFLMRPRWRDKETTFILLFSVLPPLDLLYIVFIVDLLESLHKDKSGYFLINTNHNTRDIIGLSNVRVGVNYERRCYISSMT